MMYTYKCRLLSYSMFRCVKNDQQERIQSDLSSVDKKSLAAYFGVTSAKSEVGIETPLLQGAQVASHAMRLFLCVHTPVLVGRMGSFRAGRFLVAVVSTRSAHLLFEIETSLAVAITSLYKVLLMIDSNRDTTVSISQTQLNDIQKALTALIDVIACLHALKELRGLDSLPLASLQARYSDLLKQIEGAE